MVSGAQDSYHTLETIFVQSIEGLTRPNTASMQAMQQQFSLLIQFYEGSGRFYHNVHHIADCLNKSRECISNITLMEHEILMLYLAIFFHDVIYDPKSSLNEEMSAEMCRRVLSTLGVKEETINQICRMILLTKHCGKENTELDLLPYEALLLDIDLSILGDPLPTYQIYEMNIRKEYEFVEFSAYNKGRSAILNSFLAKAKNRRLFVSPAFMGSENAIGFHHNDQAVENIEWALQQLDHALIDYEQAEQLPLTPPPPVPTAAEGILPTSIPLDAIDDSIDPYELVNALK